jgi:hypothetical protein
MSSIKSAFSPMRARIDPAVAAKLPAIPEPDKPIDVEPSIAAHDDADRLHRSSDPVSVPTSDRPTSDKSGITTPNVAVVPNEIVPIELETLVVHDTEKSNIGFALQGLDPVSKTRAIVGVLNRANPLTEGALRSNDSKLVAFLWGIVVAEAIILRRKHKAVEAVYNHLIAKLNPPGGFVTALGFALATRLAQPFDKLPIYGPDRPDRIPYIAVASLEVPMSPEVAARPWGKVETLEGTKP